MNQLTRGQKTRLMYVENKDGTIDGVDARIGYVTFSKTGRTVYYRGRELVRAGGIRGNFLAVATREEYWISGIKLRGSNVHQSEPAAVRVDEDAAAEYRAIKDR